MENIKTNTITNWQERKTIAQEKLEEKLEQNYFSVKPKNYENLDIIQQNYFSRLDNYSGQFIEEKFYMEQNIEETQGIFSSKNEYKEAFTELKKFFALTKLYGKGLAMTSPKVDEVWHQFILFTREYHSFCDEFIGRYLHHEPNIPSRMTKKSLDESFHNFVHSYRQTYGKIPEIWGIKQS
ncbi:MAG TPA: hypothetical protein VEC16_07070 [Alphaproteobacteria bacterium]|nr:hypothetical protein [Alphaproteobacteria bacterium]